MRVDALRPYEHSLLTAEPLRLWHADGRVVDLDIERWLAPADVVDTDVLSRALAPVLDVGCGPGRMVRALADYGLLALGIDIAKTAVEMTRRQGVSALHRSVFDQLPGEGRWQTLLLLDGNIGIGGEPDLLLSRAHRLLAPAGRLIIETDADPSVDEQCVVRFTRTDKPIGPAFRWAHVGLEAASRYAVRAGYAVTEVWTADGRTFLAAQAHQGVESADESTSATPRPRRPVSITPRRRVGSRRERGACPSRWWPNCSPRSVGRRGHAIESPTSTPRRPR